MTLTREQIETIMEHGYLSIQKENGGYFLNSDDYLMPLCRLALERLEMGEGWRPIETAPKDGTIIIVYRPNGSPNGYIPQVGYDYWYKGMAWGRSNADTQPTLWQPLPAAPQVKP